MDLSFPTILPDREITVLPGDLAAVIAVAGGYGGRHGGASPTARVQYILDARAPADRFAPVDGSFNAAVAAALARWREE